MFCTITVRGKDLSSANVKYCVGASRDLSFRRLEGITQAAVDAFLHNPLPFAKIIFKEEMVHAKNIWNICSKMVTDCGNFTEIIMDDGIGGAKAERGIFG